MTEQTKKKMGRPKKEKKGAMIWCPDFCLDMVQAIIETAKQQQQQKQVTQ
jgi:hypothetical protein